VGRRATDPDVVAGLAVEAVSTRAAAGSYQVVASHRYRKADTYRTATQILAWPPGLVLAQVQGKVVAGGKARYPVVAPPNRASDHR
jgi:hypothetical protein